MTAIAYTKTATLPLLSDEKLYRRIGLIVLATDLTTEYDFIRMCNDSRIRLHISRIDYTNPVTPENLRAMKNGLADAAALLAPDVPLQAVYFSCTSSGALLGDSTVREKIQSAKGDVPVITPLSAASSACASFDVKKLSVLTPYTEDVAASVGDYFQNQGLTVVNIACMGLEDDRIMARITTDSIIEAAKETVVADEEALFISCTALRSAEVASKIEQEIGKPVITSNQAAAWRSLTIAGIEPRVSGFGKLLSLKRD